MKYDTIWIDQTQKSLSSIFFFFSVEDFSQHPFANSHVVKGRQSWAVFTVQQVMNLPLREDSTGTAGEPLISFSNITSAALRLTVTEGLCHPCSQLTGEWHSASVQRALLTGAGLRGRRWGSWGPFLRKHTFWTLSSESRSHHWGMPSMRGLYMSM